MTKNSKGSISFLKEIQNVCSSSIIHKLWLGSVIFRVAIFIFGVILLLFFLISITILKGFQSALLTPPQTFTAIQTPTINPTENQVPDGNLENWKTYTDLKWKYQVSYPASWEEPRETHPVSDYTVGFISSDRDSNTFKAETPGAPTYVLYITVYRKTKSTLEEESKLRGAEVPQCALGDPCPPFPPKEIIKKSNSRFKEYYSVLTSSNLKHTIIPLPSDDRYYVDIWTWYTWPENDSGLYDQILSTFRFLGGKQKLDTSTWEKTASICGFTLKIPPDWKTNPKVPTQNYPCYQLASPDFKYFGDGSSGTYFSIGRARKSQTIASEKDYVSLNNLAEFFTNEVKLGNFSGIANFDPIDFERLYLHSFVFSTENYIYEIEWYIEDHKYIDIPYTIIESIETLNNSFY